MCLRVSYQAQTGTRSDKKQITCNKMIYRWVIIFYREVTQIIFLIKIECHSIEPGELSKFVWVFNFFFWVTGRICQSKIFDPSYRQRITVGYRKVLGLYFKYSLCLFDLFDKAWETFTSLHVNFVVHTFKICTKILHKNFFKKLESLMLVIY